ncbi:DUF6445 family protein [Alteriqipengyuania lutimaris]|nr:DUF6445 family protein [Alteriqipengyuania lutimaris]MBB3034938.1 hypothetical protein [Alteriqipengyuania lutimaris]
MPSPVPLPDTPLPDAEVTLHRFGREREPVVQIDGFSGDVEGLLDAGRSAGYAPAGAFYPGLRAPADPAYLDRRRDIVAEILRRVFGFRERMRVEAASYSLVTLREDALSPLQCVPHFDDTGPGVVAVMHYLLGPESGGTAFYRHRRTGFEAITPARKPRYDAAFAHDEREFGPPPRRYYYGDSERYELIGEIAAAPDRLIMYRGRLLHSGIIPQPEALSPDPAGGRLTINMFLEGS